MITGVFNYVANPILTRNYANENVYLKCDTSGGPVTINLCQIAELKGFNNLKIFINDETGNAAANPITINSVGGDKIDDGTSVVINKNDGAVLIQVADNNSWIALEGTPSSAGFITPIEYQLGNFQNPAYDLVLTPMGNSLLGVVIVNCKLNSLKLPVNEILSSIVVSSLTLTEDMTFTLAGYNNLKKITLNNIKGLNLNTISWQDRESLEEIFLSNTIDTVVSSGNWVVGNYDVLVNLKILTIQTASQLVSQGNIENSPNLVKYVITSCLNLTTIGTLKNVTSQTLQINIQSAPSLTTIGDFTNLKPVEVLNMVIVDNLGLTTIGSLIDSFAPVSSYDLSNNALAAPVVDQILLDFDANGNLGAFLNLAGGTNAGFGGLSPAAAAAHASLLGKGWTIFMNP